LNLTVLVDETGKIASLKTPDQLQIEVNDIQLLIDQLKEEEEEARESGQFIQLAQIMQDIDSYVSKKEFLENLLLGDSNKAMNSLTEWSSSLLGQPPAPEGGNQAQTLESES